ncbi:MAG TPA: hypothetical protein VHC44_09300, partial [Verrucomicrobiae bacterium]|nr:hypothetical protein [Verrucomicrobiae bacterium]
TGGTAIDGEDYTGISGTLSWANGDATAKTFSIPILNNSPAGTNRTVFLTLSNATGGAYLSSPFNAVLTITNVTPPLSSYATWKLAHFGADANDPAVAGDNADPDGDGIPNILEYAFGSDPMVADANKPLIGTIGSNYFQLQFNRNTLATDLTYSAEAAFGFPGTWSNLATYLPGSGWTTNTPGSTVTESSLDDSNQIMQVIITDPMDPSTTNRFFQLNVHE